MCQAARRAIKKPEADSRRQSVTEANSAERVVMRVLGAGGAKGLPHSQHRDRTPRA